MSGSVIDLGELRHGPELEPAPSPRPPRAKGRPLRCALALLLALATLAAAGPPPPGRTVVTVPAEAGADVQIDGDLVLVINPVTVQAPQWRLAAFRLSDGEPVWDTPLPGKARFWGIQPKDGLLLLTGYEIGADARDTLTVALDRATGAYRWQQPGGSFELADGNVLLQSVGEDQPLSLRVVDPCCGTVRWQLSTPTAGVTAQPVGEKADRVVLSDVRGPVEVRDALTGAVRARADLRPPDGGPLGYVQVENDLLLTAGGQPGALTAYGLDRLDRRWSTTIGEIDFVQGCGAVLCLGTRSSGLWGVDPATGEVRWRSDRWAWAWPSGGQLVASTRSSDPLGDVFVVDVRTGQEVANLGRWELYQLDSSGRLLGVRPHPDGGVLVGELDVSAGTSRVADLLPDATGRCQAIAGHLLCAGTGGPYQIWQLRD
ncbi:PQQ-binding-like beta-propeller repeat protein [Micromonospora sp. NPDC085948]|uniref:outer membrane protein assembly factor BamB family protein n=1 Tax=Micromonospora sp. NPDC085948 TaxID=3155293 RepID=UPI003412416D